MAFDAFLKIEGIEGESGDSKHKNEIEILSFSWGVSNPSSHSGAGGGGGLGKVMLQDFSLTHHTDKSSPILFLACCTGKHIPSAILTCRKTGATQLEFLKIKLEDVVISNFQSGGTAADAALVPEESFSLNFTKITYAYSYDNAGQISTVSAGYDLKKATKL